MNHPEHNVLEKICDMPNGIQYRLWMVFTPEGHTQHITIGEMKAARVYKRVDAWTEEQDKLVGHVGDN